MADQDAVQRAAEARRRGLTEQQVTYVAALKAERQGYQTRGDTDRVKQVDAEIAGIQTSQATAEAPAHDMIAEGTPVQRRGRPRKA